MANITNIRIELAKRGDREAFERLLTEHYDMILRTAWRFTGNQSEAEDVAQDVCIMLAGKLEQFNGDSAFTSWLYRLVINRCKDTFKSRSARKKREESYSDIAQCLRAEEAETATSLTWLYQQIAALEVVLKETALLVLAEGLTHAQAGEVLECTESTISWRMHEIRKKLKTSWEQSHE